MKAFLINLVERELETTSLPNPEVNKNSIIGKMREDLSI
jgi:hypothetical protein